MAAGSFILYDVAISALAQASLPPLAEADIAAVLLLPSYAPDASGHMSYADLKAHELAAADYAQVRVTGSVVTPAAGGAFFISDAISWGDPVSFPPFKYMALVLGFAGSLKNADIILGVQDLNTTGAVEVNRGAVQVSPPSGGWFQITRA